PQRCTSRPPSLSTIALRKDRAVSKEGDSHALHFGNGGLPGGFQIAPRTKQLNASLAHALKGIAERVVSPVKAMVPGKGHVGESRIANGFRGLRASTNRQFCIWRTTTPSRNRCFQLAKDEVPIS